MQFSTTFSFMTMAALAAAAQSFTLLVIRSGSDVQYSSIVAENDTLYLYSGNRANTFILTDDNALYDPESKKYITVKDNTFVESSTPDKNFGNGSGYLTYKKQGFYYDANKKLVVSNGDGIALRIWEPRDVNNPTSPTTTTTPATTPKPTTTPATTPATTKPTTPATKPTTTPTTTPASKPTGKVQFGVITIRSGSKFQNGPVKKVESHPHVFSVGGDEGEDVIFTLNTDGTMSTQDGRGVYYDAQTGELGNVDPFGQLKPSNGFSIKDGALFHDEKDNWKACPSGDDKYSLADNDCTGGTPLSLKVVNEKAV